MQFIIILLFMLAPQNFNNKPLDNILMLLILSTLNDTTIINRPVKVLKNKNSFYNYNHKNNLSYTPNHDSAIKYNLRKTIGKKNCIVPQYNFHNSSTPSSNKKFCPKIINLEKEKIYNYDAINDPNINISIKSKGSSPNSVIKNSNSKYRKPTSTERDNYNKKNSTNKTYSAKIKDTSIDVLLDYTKPSTNSPTKAKNNQSQPKLQFISPESPLCDIPIIIIIIKPETENLSVKKLEYKDETINKIKLPIDSEVAPYNKPHVDSNNTLNNINTYKELKHTDIKNNTNSYRISDMINQEFRGATISVLVNNSTIITGDVILNIDSIVALKLKSNIIIFIDKNSILSFF